MNTNNKLFKLILALVGILVIVGYGAAFYFSLDEPVFFEHNYDLQVYEGEDRVDIPFNLSYITNADDDRVVIGMIFPEYPELLVQASESHFNRTNGFYWDQPFNEEIGVTYGRYNVRTVFIQMLNLAGVDNLSELALTEVTLYFSDSSEMTVDIGEIRLYTEEDDQLLEQLYGYSSSEGVVEASYKVYEDISLSTIDHHTDSYNAVTEIKVNEVNQTDAEEIVIEEGDFLGVRTVGEPSENIVDDYKLTNTYPEITLTTMDGNEQSFRLPNLSHSEPDFSFFNIYRYLRAREEM